MDKISEKLAGWFGSTPFILVHILWFSTWTFLHFDRNFDDGWKTLTIVVSLEAIFLSLFILRAENVQSRRFHNDVKHDLKTSHEILGKIEKIKKPSKK